MITDEEQRNRLVSGNKIMIAYVDSHGSRYKDPFIEMASKNIAEFQTVDLKMLNQKVCSTSSYLQALYEAKRENCEYLLYVELGTVIDWCDGPMKDIVEYIKEHSNSKLFGHILQHTNGSFYIHPQFMAIDVKWAFKNNIRCIEDPTPAHKWKAPVFERSKENFHDGYTPHWVKVSDKKERIEVIGQGVGWNILDAIFETNSEMKVWPEHIRNAKKFLYPTVKEECSKNKAVILGEMNTNRVYVANTEQITRDRYAHSLDNHDIKCVATPASGLSTFLIPFYAQAEKTLAYDINLMSLHFVEKCRQDWDGTNFKDFVLTEIVNKQHPALYKAKQEHLDSADALLKDLGDEWIDWWRTIGKRQITTKQIDIFNHHTWHNFKNHMLGDECTLLNISNIMHYAPTATLFNLQERIDILKNLHTYITTKVMKPENLLINGMSPTVSRKPIDGNLVKEDIKNELAFPWR